MRRKEEEAERWLKQAEYNLRVAESNLKADLHAAVCFMCEQAVQVALKAYLILRTGRSPLGIHSIQKLAEKCLQFDQKFKEFVEVGRILDRYYIPTRYPDALAPPAVPFETYTRKDAQEAVAKAREVVAYVKQDFGKAAA